MTSSDDAFVHDSRAFITALIDDGRPLVKLTALALLFSGAFALFLSARGEFLPHDVAFLGMTADELCMTADCRVVAFMFHDRVAFGGTLLAIGILYLWLAEFPLRNGEAWAWWTLVLSGTFGFLTFLAYLGYGYLDTWHGAGTMALAPLFAAGMIRTHRLLRAPRDIRQLARSARLDAGRIVLLATATGMILAGFTILAVGMTRVFVPQDLAFMDMTAAELNAVNPKLIPLIAHDRAGFGGGLASSGVIVWLCTWCAAPRRSLWEALLLAGIAGFGCAIGVHVRVGYVDASHLGPAVAGALMFAVGMTLSYRPMCRHAGGAAAL